MVCFESKIVQWSNLAFIYGPCSLGDAISACSELFKWGKSFSSSQPFVRSAPKFISLSPTCHRLPPLLTPKTNPISLPAPPSGSHANPSRIWFLLSVQFNQGSLLSASAWYQSWWEVSFCSRICSLYSSDPSLIIALPYPWLTVDFVWIVGFVKIDTWISLSWYIYLSKLINGFL